MFLLVCLFIGLKMIGTGDMMGFLTGSAIIITSLGVIDT